MRISARCPATTPSPDPPEGAAGSASSAAAFPVAPGLRGHKARTTPALLDEFAAAWQFPWHFGDNWFRVAV